MKHWNPFLQIIVMIIVAIGMGCAPTSTSPESTKPSPADSPTAESVSTDTPRTDSFDQSEESLFEVKAPHKIEGGILHLQISQDSVVLLASAEGLSTKGYTVSVRVMPPEVGEHVGLAFAVRGENSRVLFYLFRPAGADPFGNRCNIGLEGHIGGRKMRPPDIRMREIDFQPNTPIKLSARQVGSTVFLSVDSQTIGRFSERNLKVGKVGVYGRSQHEDDRTAVVKFDSFQIE